MRVIQLGSYLQVAIENMALMAHVNEGASLGLESLVFAMSAFALTADLLLAKQSG